MLVETTDPTRHVPVASVRVGHKRRLRDFDDHFASLTPSPTSTNLSDDYAPNVKRQRLFTSWCTLGIVAEPQPDGLTKWTLSVPYTATLEQLQTLLSTDVNAADIDVVRFAVGPHACSCVHHTQHPHNKKTRDPWKYLHPNDILALTPNVRRFMVISYTIPPYGFHHLQHKYKTPLVLPKSVASLNIDTECLSQGLIPEFQEGAVTECDIFLAQCKGETDCMSAYQVSKVANFTQPLVGRQSASVRSLTLLGCSFAFLDSNAAQVALNLACVAVTNDLTITQIPTQGIWDMSFVARQLNGMDLYSLHYSLFDTYRVANVVELTNEIVAAAHLYCISEGCSPKSPSKSHVRYADIPMGPSMRRVVLRMPIVMSLADVVNGTTPEVPTHPIIRGLYHLVWSAIRRPNERPFELVLQIPHTAKNTCRAGVFAAITGLAHALTAVGSLHTAPSVGQLTIIFAFLSTEARDEGGRCIEKSIRSARTEMSRAKWYTSLYGTSNDQQAETVYSAQRNGMQALTGPTDLDHDTN